MRDKYMIKYFDLLPIICILLIVFTPGCTKSRMGKIDLSGEAAPSFLETGTTTTHDVLEQIGEPFGYREQGDRSAMIFLNFQEDYYNFLFTQFRMEKSYRLDLVFQKNILQKAEIKKEGWGFGANVDPQLIQLLGR
ncbi:MAG: hypothetical protein QF647_00730 [SAR324 cluster bacterium]|nr:hypothetical protein [SAR324 cluster bacterium]